MRQGLLLGQETAAYNDDQSSNFIIAARTEKPKTIPRKDVSVKRQSARILNVLPSSEQSNYTPPERERKHSDSYQ